MNKNYFFKYTPLFKEFMLLDMIEKDSSITQRSLSKMIGSSVSMINTYIEENEKKGYLERVYKSNKNLEYKITKKGIERKRLLNIEYLKSSHSIYTSAKENIINFINQIIDKGYKNIFLYGAGEVAELFILVINDYRCLPLNIMGVIDDDKRKLSKSFANYKIYDKKIIVEKKPDGVLVCNYRSRDLIYKNIIELNYDKNNILMFFEI